MFPGYFCLINHTLLFSPQRSSRFKRNRTEYTLYRRFVLYQPFVFCNSRIVFFFSCRLERGCFATINQRVAERSRSRVNMVGGICSPGKDSSQVYACVCMCVYFVWRTDHSNRFIPVAYLKKVLYFSGRPPLTDARPPSFRWRELKMQLPTGGRGG